MQDQVCTVKVQRDHIQKLAASSPELALAELIWNALDADATNIDVNFKENGLGVIDSVIVRDNGEGFSLKNAASLFESLGGGLEGG